MTDYSLRLLMHVAQQEGRLCTIAEVAQRYAISEAHLMKVTHRLAQAGFIETVRGKGGGMRLAKEAGQIRLGEVVRAIETDFELAECFGTGRQCALDGNCRLAGVLTGALGEFNAYLDRYTVEDVLPGGTAALGAVIGIKLHRERGVLA